MKTILSLGLLTMLLLGSGCWSLQRAMHEIRWADIEPPTPPAQQADSTAVAAN
tara:strand:+ start:508 stop:666 length:159 start_codon:yes stop_codon:yes gene_type:complete